MGVIFSILWVVGQGYVLGQTEDTDLRAQRYEGGFCYIPETSQIIVIRCQSKILNSILCRFVDILLGLSLLLSHLVLCYGSVQERRATVTLFFILSMALLVLYWAWFGYLKYCMGDEEASKEVKNID